MWNPGGWLRYGLLAAGIVVAGAAQAGPWTSLYIFGDSLSDSGNNAAFFDAFVSPPPATLRTPVPFTDDSFIPTFPYASGRYTNQSFVWADAFATALGLTNAASLADPNPLDGTNFAFGGARTGPPAPPGFPFSLKEQVADFLTATGGVAPASALYVVEGGGNDLRDAAVAADPGPIIAAYVANVVSILTDLKGGGAVDILLWNVPDLGLSPSARFAGPATQAGATFLAQTMNSALAATLAALPSLSAGVEIFDVFGLLQGIHANPASFALTNVDNACAAGVAVCANPDDYLFWDGIHPTAAGHALLALGALAAVAPEPGTLLLFVLAGGLLVVMRLRGLTVA